MLCRSSCSGWQEGRVLVYRVPCCLRLKDNPPSPTRLALSLPKLIVHLHSSSYLDKFIHGTSPSTSCWLFQRMEACRSDVWPAYSREL
jgi:hypothetical protein